MPTSTARNPFRKIILELHDGTIIEVDPSSVLRLELDIMAVPVVEGDLRQGITRDAHLKMEMHLNNVSFSMYSEIGLPEPPKFLPVSPKFLQLPNDDESHL